MELNSGKPTGPESQPERLSGLWANILGVIGLSAITAIISVDVFMRYVLNDPLSWSLETVELLLAVLIFAAFPRLALAGGHIRMSALAEILPPRPQLVCRAIVNLVVAATWVVFAWAILRGALSMFRYGDRSDIFGIHFWPFGAFMSATALVAAVVAVWRLRRLTEGRH